MKFYGICTVCDLEIYVPMDKNSVCPTCQKLDLRTQKLKKIKRYTKRKRGQFAS